RLQLTRKNRQVCLRQTSEGFFSGRNLLGAESKRGSAVNSGFRKHLRRSLQFEVRKRLGNQRFRTGGTCGAPSKSAVLFSGWLGQCSEPKGRSETGVRSPARY